MRGAGTHVVQSAGAASRGGRVPGTGAAWLDTGRGRASSRRHGDAVEPASERLLPDLELVPLYGLTIRTNRVGRKRLRFGTRAFNIGDGPLEVRGRARVKKKMTEIVQWISDGKGGGYEVAQPKAVMFWSGDGHSHWHVEKFITVELYKPGNLAGTRRVRKLGFCLIDLIRSSDPPPNTPPTRGYPLNACGTSSTVSRITMGISVGYADDYQPLIKHQWIDITTLPKGVYRLCAKVNPFGHWQESTLANNYFWHDVWINAKRSRSEIRASGRTPCGSYT